MKITAITTHVVNAELRNWLFVRVETDEAGLYGWGEATLEWKSRAVEGAIADLAPILIGHDPRDIENAARAVRKHGFWQPLGVIGMTALSGIEMALWDILGKSLGVPVWRLLGGKVRDRVPVYTHLGLGEMNAVYNTMDASSLVERGLAVKEKGYRAMKVVNVPYTHYTATPRALADFEASMGALREAVGPEIELMVDFHGRCASAGAALAFLKVLEPFGVMFAEEPIPPGDVASMKAIAMASRVPIAHGERLTSAQDFAPYIEARAMTVAQPDLCHCGGFSEARRIAALAEVAGIGLAPHNPLGPIAGVAALHFDIATPNVVIQEEMTGAVPWYFEVVEGPIRRVDGYWQLPEAPGLGVEVDLAVAARHPFRQEPFPTRAAALPDGTIVDW
ncbi:D-galactonate dehydratase [Kaistia geumhonensis]|uniref:Galactonate dehydratase n=1 Tax=Kaistia geumhonensis TaxID=410839 RepID=A0ABU0M9P6_9HYPH|nr:enolase C-terminal domain-like protein [Kaistia geumhonensis]MCX5480596.1 D-galactonate dehydratase [Kaistia geumhonensis]MDQ0517702.1 galactonate dehydratase [Kaistia geumhonensis]